MKLFITSNSIVVEGHRLFLPIMKQIKEVMVKNNLRYCRIVRANNTCYLSAYSTRENIFTAAIEIIAEFGGGYVII